MKLKQCVLGWVCAIGSLQLEMFVFVLLLTVAKQVHYGGYGLQMMAESHSLTAVISRAGTAGLLSYDLADK